jgi:outer membrane receptor protein involved in Fe transport
MSKTFFRGVLLTSTVITGLALSSGASAQTSAQPTPQEGEPSVQPQDAIQEDQVAQEASRPGTQTGSEGGEIIVTGSRISRPNLEQSSPVQVVGAEEISFQQPTTAEELLRDLPGVAPGINSAVNNGSNGTATFNLRNLGANRNLVLLNERRLVPAGLNNVVDLNVIPLALIERVDVFTGGASSTYGADAVAGVVNFITRRSFSGIDLSANYGITERGDGANYRFDLVTGANFDEGRGNVVLGVSHTSVEPVLQGQRNIGRVARQSTVCSAAQTAANPTACASTTQGLPQGSPTAVPASLFFPLGIAGNPIQAAGGGAFNPTGGNIIAGLSDYNFQPINLFQTPLDRWSIFSSGRYEISSAVELFSEALFSRTRVRQELAPTGTFTNQFRLPLNNQFLTPAQRLQLCELAVGSTGAFPATGQPTGAVIPTNAAGCGAAIASGTEINTIIARRFVESGPRTATFNSNLFQVSGGARGPLTSTLEWEVSGQYGESDRQSSNTNGALADRVQQALRGCPAGSTAGCVPLNIFGPAGSITPAQLGFLGVTTSTFTYTKYRGVQGVVSGDLGFASPFANTPIGIAVGAEYRKYEAEQFGDLPSSTPGAVLGAGGAFTAIKGQYSSKEAFAEINVPLIEDSFIHNATLEAGARYADYTTTGGDWTYKVGGSISPIRDIKLRGTYARAVRAPNIGELFAPTNTVLNNLATDPCQGTRDQITARGAGFVALCEAQVQAIGLPASTVGGISPPPAGQINVTGGGNLNLRPEVATTKTVGIVLQPSFLRGFTATVDWFNIQVKGAVSAPTVGDVLNGCFSGTSNAQLCTLIRRNPLTGGLGGDPATTQGVILASSNLGFLETEGVDFSASYGLGVGTLGRLNLNFNGSYTNKSRFQALPTSFVRECTGFYSVSCDPPLPEWSWNFRTTLAMRSGTDVSLLWRHISGTSAEPRTGANATTPPAAGTVGSYNSTNPATFIEAYRNIPAYDYFDLSLQQAIGERLTLTFLAQNLLDKDPPAVGQTIGSTGFNSGGTYPSVYDAIGRRFVVGARLRF